MRFLKKQTEFDFLGVSKLAMTLSLVLIVGSIVSLVMRGLNFGIDFTGGTLIEVSYDGDVRLDDVRQALAGDDFGDATVQFFGTSSEVLIRIAPKGGATQSELSNRVMDRLRAESDSEITLRRVEFVGPQVGQELTEQGGLAMLATLFGILIYVTLRFEWRLSVGSVIALAHDTILTLGVFSALFIPFDLSVMAAVLAVIGYSLNDTIVVFDRIRENFRKMRKGTPQSIVNVSINQTLSRTIKTGVTTLLVLFALFFLGGEAIHGFSLALIIGIVVGTYSSIYVASALAVALGLNKTDLMQVRKEGAEASDQP